MIPAEVICHRIFIIRGMKIMIDEDLAQLYGVLTRRLNEQVKRNKKRFPKDFCFRMTQKDIDILKSHFATSSWGGRRKLPLAFTEQGVAMLSSVLNSDRAIEVNIQIMRTFSKLREYMATHKDLRQKVEELEKKYDQQFKVVFDAIKGLIIYPNEAYKKTKIGFITDQ
jgi:hypothetical protein